jgi:hypothetical protein
MVLLKILGAILFGAIIIAIALVLFMVIASSIVWIIEKLKKFSSWCIIGKILKWICFTIFGIIVAFWLGIYLFAIGAGALESLFGIVILL